jgi:hypothetical protein
VNLLLLAGAAAVRASAAIGGAEPWMVGLLVLRRGARRHGRAAHRRRRHARGDLPAERVHRAVGAAAGLALNNTAMIVAG